MFVEFHDLEHNARYKRAAKGKLSKKVSKAKLQGDPDIKGTKGQRKKSDQKEGTGRLQEQRRNERLDTKGEQNKSKGKGKGPNKLNKGRKGIVEANGPRDVFGQREKAHVKGKDNRHTAKGKGKLNAKGKGKQGRGHSSRRQDLESFDLPDRTSVTIRGFGEPIILDLKRKRRLANPDERVIFSLSGRGSIEKKSFKKVAKKVNSF